MSNAGAIQRIRMVLRPVLLTTAVVEYPDRNRIARGKAKGSVSRPTIDTPADTPKKNPAMGGRYAASRMMAKSLLPASLPRMTTNQLMRTLIC